MEMNDNRLVLLKLGGSLITDKSTPFVARQKVIRRLGKEIKEAMGRFEKLIIAHGSGSFGHSAAKKYGVEKGWEHKRGLEGVPLVADAAAKINRIVVEELLKSGLPVVSFAPASLVFADSSRPADIFLGPISQCLNWGMIPVLYGDIIFDRKKGWCIFSSEKILNILAKSFRRDFSELSNFIAVTPTVSMMRAEPRLRLLLRNRLKKSAERLADLGQRMSPAGCCIKLRKR